MIVSKYLVYCCAIESILNLLENVKVDVLGFSRSNLSLHVLMSLFQPRIVSEIVSIAKSTCDKNVREIILLHCSPYNDIIFLLHTHH